MEAHLYRLSDKTVARLIGTEMGFIYYFILYRFAIATSVYKLNKLEPNTSYLEGIWPSARLRPLCRLLPPLRRRPSRPRVENGSLSAESVHVWITNVTTSTIVNFHQHHWQHHHHHHHHRQFPPTPPSPPGCRRGSGWRPPHWCRWSLSLCLALPRNNRWEDFYRIRIKDGFLIQIVMQWWSMM